MDTESVDAVGQAELVRTGQCTPADLVEAAISRAEHVNPRINAIIHRRFDKARAEAAGDAALNAPLRGVPFAVKDLLCQTAGDPYHLGMRPLRDRNWTAPTDSYLAENFRAAGLIVVGRTNTPELATSTTTEPIAYGPTRNPWDTSRSVGGSSGGSAAAVASGIVPAAHGNDMGGSIRIPASACGLVGLKPSRGRTSLGPDFGDYWAGMTHEGVLTRTVRDTAAILDCVAGPRSGDPYTAPPFSRPLSDEIHADPPPLRIGVRTTVPVSMAEPDPECAAAVTAAAAQLESVGHVVEPAWPEAMDMPDEAAAYVPVFGAAIARELDRWSEHLGIEIGQGDVEPVTWMLAETGRAQNIGQYLASVERFQQHARHLASWWDGSFDLLLTPTMADPPPELGRGSADAGLEPAFALMSRMASYVIPWDLTGQPAISLPLHWTESGLPVGVQLVAAYGREDLLIRVAAALERAMPWHGRRPPVRPRVQGQEA
jgi:amidase